MLRSMVPATAWPAPGEIHLWTVNLDQPRHACATLQRLLDEGEQERARRFWFERDRRRFMVCRAALRRALSAYLDLTPQGIRFTYSPRGKPSVTSLAHMALDFNVSHAGDRGVLAFSSQPVGVDIESTDREVDIEGIATRFFAPAEAQDLMEIPIAERREAFFNCWTRKEAYIKALGDGLGRSLHSFSVTLRNADAAALRWSADDDERCWSIRAFAPIEGYVGAVAIRRRTVSVTVRDWKDTLDRWSDPAPLEKA